MAQKEIYCSQARRSVDKSYCLSKCDSAQKGFKSICPEPIYPQLDKETFWQEINDLSEETSLAVKPILIC